MATETMDQFKRKAVQVLADELSEEGTYNKTYYWNKALRLITVLDSNGLILTGERVMEIQLSVLEMNRG